MNETKKFIGKDFIKDIAVLIILSICTYFAFCYNFFTGIMLMLITSISIIPVFQDDIITILLPNKLVVHKIFRKKEVLLNEVISLKKERRIYGRYTTRECLVILLKEDSGYIDELVYPYDNKMHTLLNKYIKNLSK